jgi:hypothetical protein
MAGMWYDYNRYRVFFLFIKWLSVFSGGGRGTGFEPSPRRPAEREVAQRKALALGGSETAS